MFSLVLSAAVLVSSGGLLSERTPTEGMLIGAVNLRGAGALYDNMTVEELTAQRAIVANSLPSMGLGIALTCIGGGVLLTGLTIVAVAQFLEILLVGLVVMAAGIPLVIIGIVMIARVARERRDAQAELRLIDQRIAGIKRDEFAPPPVDQPAYDPKNEPPPPPPMRPPGSEFAPNDADCPVALELTRI